MREGGMMLQHIANFIYQGIRTGWLWCGLILISVPVMAWRIG